MSLSKVTEYGVLSTVAAGQSKLQSWLLAGRRTTNDFRVARSNTSNLEHCPQWSVRLAAAVLTLECNGVSNWKVVECSRQGACSSFTTLLVVRIDTHTPIQQQGTAGLCVVGKQSYL